MKNSYVFFAIVDMRIYCLRPVIPEHEEKPFFEVCLLSVSSIILVFLILAEGRVTVT